MFSLKQAAIFALAGTALAAPLARRDGQQAGRMSTNYGFEIEGNTIVPVDSQPAGSEFVGYTVITIYPNGGSAPTPTYQAPAAAATSPVVVVASTTAAASSPASTGSGSSSGGGTADYMAVVNKWRAAGGLSALKQDTTLEGNAQKTVNDDHGTMSHELNPGSFAQVLAPGQTSDFEHCYVGGWLCEMPNLPGLNGICAQQGQGWSHNGETGHAEILTDPKYSKIGCAWSDGIWGCDLA